MLFGITHCNDRPYKTEQVSPERPVTAVFKYLHNYSSCNFPGVSHSSKHCQNPMFTLWSKRQIRIFFTRTHDMCGFLILAVLMLSTAGFRFHLRIIFKIWFSTLKTQHKMFLSAKQWETGTNIKLPLFVVTRQNLCYHLCCDFPHCQIFSLSIHLKNLLMIKYLHEIKLDDVYVRKVVFSILIFKNL